MPRINAHIASVLIGSLKPQRSIPTITLVNIKEKKFSRNIPETVINILPGPAASQISRVTEIDDDATDTQSGVTEEQDSNISEEGLSSSWTSSLSQTTTGFVAYSPSEIKTLNLAPQKALRLNDVHYSLLVSRMAPFDVHGLRRFDGPNVQAQAICEVKTNKAGYLFAPVRFMLDEDHFVHARRKGNSFELLHQVDQVETRWLREQLQDRGFNDIQARAVPANTFDHLHLDLNTIFHAALTLGAGGHVRYGLLCMDPDSGRLYVVHCAESKVRLFEQTLTACDEDTEPYADKLLRATLTSMVKTASNRHLPASELGDKVDIPGLRIIGIVDSNSPCLLDSPHALQPIIAHARTVQNALLFNWIEGTKLDPGLMKKIRRYNMNLRVSERRAFVAERQAQAEHVKQVDTAGTTLQHADTVTPDHGLGITGLSVAGNKQDDQRESKPDPPAQGRTILIPTSQRKRSLAKSESTGTASNAACTTANDLAQTPDDAQLMVDLRRLTEVVSARSDTAPVVIKFVNDSSEKPVDATSTAAQKKKKNKKKNKKLSETDKAKKRAYKVRRREERQDESEIEERNRAAATTLLAEHIFKMFTPICLPNGKVMAHEEFFATIQLLLKRYPRWAQELGVNGGV